MIESTHRPEVGCSAAWRSVTLQHRANALSRGMQIHQRTHPMPYRILERLAETAVGTGLPNAAWTGNYPFVSLFAPCRPSPRWTPNTHELIAAPVKVPGAA